eukprot:COSAG05_NODE_2998_length_2423_cov_36.645009_3_plen_44_part_00
MGRMGRKLGQVLGPADAPPIASNEDVLVRGKAGRCMEHLRYAR